MQEKNAIDQAYLDGVIYAVKEALDSPMPPPSTNKSYANNMTVLRKPVGAPVTRGKIPSPPTTGLKLAELLAKHGQSPFTTPGKPIPLPSLKSKVTGATTGMLNKKLTAGPAGGGIASTNVGTPKRLTAPSV